MPAFQTTAFIATLFLEAHPAWAGEPEQVCTLCALLPARARTL